MKKVFFVLFLLTGFNIAANDCARQRKNDWCTCRFSGERPSDYILKFGQCIYKSGNLVCSCEQYIEI